MWIAKTLIRLGRLFCWFCHVAAQMWNSVGFSVSDAWLIEPSQENLSAGFATRIDSNWPVQPQKLGRGLKFRI